MPSQIKKILATVVVLMFTSTGVYMVSIGGDMFHGFSKMKKTNFKIVRQINHDPVRKRKKLAV